MSLIDKTRFSFTFSKQNIIFEAPFFFELFKILSRTTDNSIGWNYFSNFNLLSENSYFISLCNDP